MADTHTRDLPTQPTEARRERLVRCRVCPACSIGSGHGCDYDGFVGGSAVRYSHTARYNLAAADGLVPAMAGAR